jgi:hypothetical protein
MKALFTAKLHKFVVRRNRCSSRKYTLSAPAVTVYIFYFDSPIFDQFRNRLWWNFGICVRWRIH